MGLAEAVYRRLRKALGEIHFSPRQAAKKIFSIRYLFIFAFFVALAMIVYFVAQHRRPAFELLRDHLRVRGINVGPAMTMEEALVELHRTQPEMAAAFAPLIALYEEEQLSAHGRPAREHIRPRLAELTVNR